MNILPKPQLTETKSGNLRSKTLAIYNLCEDARIEKALSCFPKGIDGVELTVKCDNKNTEGYTLDIREDGIEISADSPAGAYAYCNLHGLWKADI